MEIRKKLSIALLITFFCICGFSASAMATMERILDGHAVLVMDGNFDMQTDEILKAANKLAGPGEHRVHLVITDRIFPNVEAWSRFVDGIEEKNEFRDSDGLINFNVICIAATSSGDHIRISVGRGMDMLPIGDVSKVREIVDAMQERFVGGEYAEGLIFGIKKVGWLINVRYIILMSVVSGVGITALLFIIIYFIAYFAVVKKKEQREKRAINERIRYLRYLSELIDGYLTKLCAIENSPLEAVWMAYGGDKSWLNDRFGIIQGTLRDGLSSAAHRRRGIRGPLNVEKSDIEEFRQLEHEWVDEVIFLLGTTSLSLSVIGLVDMINLMYGLREDIVGKEISEKISVIVPSFNTIVPDKNIAEAFSIDLKSFGHSSKCSGLMDYVIGVRTNILTLQVERKKAREELKKIRAAVSVVTLPSIPGINNGELKTAIDVKKATEIAKLINENEIIKARNEMALITEFLYEIDNFVENLVPISRTHLANLGVISSRKDLGYDVGNVLGEQKVSLDETGGVIFTEVNKDILKLDLISAGEILASIKRSSEAAREVSDHQVELHRSNHEALQQLRVSNERALPFYERAIKSFAKLEKLPEDNYQDVKDALRNAIVQFRRESYEDKTPFEINEIAVLEASNSLKGTQDFAAVKLLIEKTEKALWKFHEVFHAVIDRWNWTEKMEKELPGHFSDFDSKIDETKGLERYPSDEVDGLFVEVDKLRVACGNAFAEKKFVSAYAEYKKAMETLKEVVQRIMAQNDEVGQWSDQNSALRKKISTETEDLNRRYEAARGAEADWKSVNLAGKFYNLITNLPTISFSDSITYVKRRTVLSKNNVKLKEVLHFFDKAFSEALKEDEKRLADLRLELAETIKSVKLRHSWAKENVINSRAKGFGIDSISSDYDDIVNCNIEAVIASLMTVSVIEGMLNRAEDADKEFFVVGADAEDMIEEVILEEEAESAEEGSSRGKDESICD